MLFAQDCYTVKAVTTEVEMEEISQRRITFGIKQMMEDIISDKYDLCLDGKPVEVQVTSIEAPTTGIEIGPWTKVSKKTIVTLLVYMDGKIIEVEGKAKSTVKATFKLHFIHTRRRYPTKSNKKHIHTNNQHVTKTYSHRPPRQKTNTHTHTH